MQAHFQMNRDHGRRGSTLVVVLALLALLSILGLSFVLFAGSEKTSAENFAAAAESKTRDRPRPTTSVLTRFASRRLLTGSLDSERNSALYGGRHTLLASLVGRDVHPHSGRGVNIIEMPSNSLSTRLPVVDQSPVRQVIPKPLHPVIFLVGKPLGMHHEFDQMVPHLIRTNTGTNGKKKIDN